MTATNRAARRRATETEGAASSGRTSGEDGAPVDPEALENAGDVAPDRGGDAAASVARAADGVFALPARSRAEDAEALLAWLRGPAADAPVVFDASAVESLSTPCALAIVAAARAGAAAGTPAAVARPSPAFVDALSDLGLFQDLMKMEFRP